MSTTVEDRLRDRIERLESENARLRAEVSRLTIDRDGYEFRVRTELEPMIERDKRNYDHWATSPERG